jgi:hypothetical protein
MKRETIDTLHEKARLAIASGEKALGERAREAAEYLAEARQLGATQRDSAKAIGKSAPWVNALLRWRDGGYLTVFPFPRAARPLFGPRGRVQAAEQRKEQRKQSEKRRYSIALAELQTAKLNAARAKDEAQKAKADASKARAKAKAEKERRSNETALPAFLFASHRIPSEARELLIKALGMLGSDQAGERASAALVVEKQRAKLGMTWEELIIPAEEADLGRAA